MLQDFDSRLADLRVKIIRERIRPQKDNVVVAVIPAEAGTQSMFWAPAFAEVTSKEPSF